MTVNCHKNLERASKTTTAEKNEEILNRGRIIKRGIFVNQKTKRKNTKLPLEKFKNSECVSPK